MNASSSEFEELLRRIVRDEVRAALADMIPADVGPLLTYKKAAEELNAWWRCPWDTRKRLTVRDVRAHVDLGLLPAVRFGSRPPRIALTELRWLDDWHRHTRDEKDREYRELRQAEREYMKAARQKRGSRALQQQGQRSRSRAARPSLPPSTSTRARVRRRSRRRSPDCG